MRFISVCIIALGMVNVQNVCAVELVTPEEARSSQQAAMLEAELTAPDPLAPSIQLIDPDGLERPLKKWEEKAHITHLTKWETLLVLM